MTRATILLSLVLAIACGSAHAQQCLSSADIGLPCADDGVSCTTDVCESDGAGGVVCNHTTDDTLCDDSVGCTTEVCTPTGCEITEDDSVCADAFSCTDDQCSRNGAAGTSGCFNVNNDPACNDFYDCSVDTCTPGAPGSDPVTGCSYDIALCTCTDGEPSGAPCAGDGVSCTRDACDGDGNCVSIRDDRRCPSDGLACTFDTCEPTGATADANGCVYQPDSGRCDDDIFCTDNVCAPEDSAADSDGCTFPSSVDRCQDGVECSEAVCTPANPLADSQGCVVNNSDCCARTCRPAYTCGPDGCGGQCGSGCLGNSKRCSGVTRTCKCAVADGLQGCTAPDTSRNMASVASGCRCEATAISGKSTRDSFTLRNGFPRELATELPFATVTYDITGYRHANDTADAVSGIQAFRIFTGGARSALSRQIGNAGFESTGLYFWLSIDDSQSFITRADNSQSPRRIDKEVTEPYRFTVDLIEGVAEVYDTRGALFYFDADTAQWIPAASTCTVATPPPEVWRQAAPQQLVGYGCRRGDYGFFVVDPDNTLRVRGPGLGHYPWHGSVVGVRAYNPLVLRHVEVPGEAVAGGGDITVRVRRGIAIDADDLVNRVTGPNFKEFGTLPAPRFAGRNQMVRLPHSLNIFMRPGDVLQIAVIRENGRIFTTSEQLGDSSDITSDGLFADGNLELDVNSAGCCHDNYPLCPSTASFPDCFFVADGYAFNGAVVYDLIAAAGQDPHFIGFGGERFDVQGEDGDVANLVSERSFQLNARFAHPQCRDGRDSGDDAEERTVISEVGVVVLGRRISFGGPGRVLYVDDTEVVDGQRVVLAEANAAEGEYEQSYVQVVDGELSLETPAWSVYAQTARPCGKAGEARDLHRLDVSVSLHQPHLNPHGLLGQTVRRASMTQDHLEPEMTKMAGREHLRSAHKYTHRFSPEGAAEDYVVRSGDLFGADFVHNRFDAANADIGRGAPVDDRMEDAVAGVKHPRYADLRPDLV